MGYWESVTSDMDWNEYFKFLFSSNNGEGDEQNGIDRTRET